MTLPLYTERIIEALAASPPIDPHLAPLMEQMRLKPSAVLLPLFEKPHGWEILFTRRSHKVSSHKGEISFPGGRVDETDHRAEDTALRETQEEIGVRPESIQLLGRLPDSYSIAGYRITPFVGKVEEIQRFHPNPYEIDEIFCVPLQDLIQPGVLRIHHRVLAGEHQHDVYVFNWKEDYPIWGATARILKTFLEQLWGEIPLDVAEEPPLLTYPLPSQMAQR